MSATDSERIQIGRPAKLFAGEANPRPVEPSVTAPVRDTTNARPSSAQPSHRKRQGPPQKAPGQYYREGISLMEMSDMIAPPRSGLPIPAGPAECSARIAARTT